MQQEHPINALLEPIIFKEMKKLMYAHITFPIHHSTWVENLVPVQKKNGEIRLCVDFSNLNRASKKDNYTVPSLDEVLQIINDSQIISFLNSYSGYNQFLV